MRHATDDVVSLPPNRERTDGKDALRAFALEFTGADEWSIKFQASEVTVAGSGDIAHAVGTYRFHIVDPDGWQWASRRPDIWTYHIGDSAFWMAYVVFGAFVTYRGLLRGSESEDSTAEVLALE